MTASPMAGRRDLLAGAIAAGLAVAGEARPQAAAGYSVRWLGGPTFLLTFGPVRLLGDPVTGDYFTMGDPNDARDHMTPRRHQRATALGRLDCGSVDAVLLSHAHEDHFDAAAAQCIPHRTLVLLPPADREKIGARGFRNLEPLPWGSQRRLRAGAGVITITALPAHHSRREDVARTLGRGNGYWIELVRRGWRRTIYWTGDTMATAEVVAAVTARGRPDLMIAHLGGVGDTGPFGRISMKAVDAVEMADAVRPHRILPIHHSTFAFYREPIAEFMRLASAKPYAIDLGTAPFTKEYG